MSSILAIDSGNSYLKWIYSIDGQHMDCNKVLNCDVEKSFQAWNKLKQPDMIVISQVSGMTIRNRLVKFFKTWNTQPQWISALPKQCGVINNYEQPERLGSDRWAAIIGAWNRCHASCLVVNIGTTMTVDLLSDDGIFLGGIIVPGTFITLNCIQQNTQISLDDKKNICYATLPVNTEEAVYGGVVQSLIGAIERMMRAFEHHQGVAVRNCILSGGGVVEIQPYIHFNHTVIDNLVLDGLILIANDMQ